MGASQIVLTSVSGFDSAEASTTGSHAVDENDDRCRCCNLLISQLVLGRIYVLIRLNTC